MSRLGSFSESASRLRARLRRAGVLLITPVALAGCVSLESAVPPAATLVARGRDAATLEAGRRVYLDACTRCHVAVPVRDYAAPRWPGIIDDMAERSKLSPDQHRAVLAYVLAAARGK